MSSDEELSRHLTAVVRGLEGVVGVYPAQPLLEAAADTVAVRLAMRAPDTLVDIDRAPGFVTVGAHIATSIELPAADVVRAVGERLRAELQDDGSVSTEVAVNVKIRLIEGAGS